MTEPNHDWGRVVRGGGVDAGPVGRSCDFRENFRAIVKFARAGGPRSEVQARVDRLDLFPDEKRVLAAMIAVALGERDDALSPPMSRMRNGVEP